MKTEHLKKAVSELGLFIADNAGANDYETAQIKAVAVFAAAFFAGAGNGFSSPYDPAGKTAEQARREFAENICRGSVVIKK